MDESAPIESIAGRFELAFDGAVDLTIGKLPGVGPKTAKRLSERGIANISDLLLTFPRKYRSVIRNASGRTLGAERPEFATFVAVVEWVKRPGKYSRAPLEVAVSVDGLTVRLIWFNMQDWFSKSFEKGRIVDVEGAMDWDRGTPQMSHPKVSVLKSLPNRAEVVEIEPIYTSYEGVKDAVFRAALVEAARRVLPHVRSALPESIQRSQGLGTATRALEVIHQLEATPPDTLEEALQKARQRVIFEEFFTLQVELARQYAAGRRKGRAPQILAWDAAARFVESLPFDLTRDQASAIDVLAGDLKSRVPMRRLLQGDVGSGKTVVALACAVACAQTGWQTAFVAPTEVLATQHYERAQQMLGEFPITLGLLKGSTPAAERQKTLQALRDGSLHVVFGTHALFSDDVVFAAGDAAQPSLLGPQAAGLGLVVFDEHHKFGVEQRDTLIGKGTDPHLLAMTATPIPRSLAHAFFGDLDLAVIREKPAERVPIRTILRPRAVAEKVHTWVREKVEAGEQAYYIYPLVEASQGWEHRSNVVEEAQRLANGPFAGLRVGVLHGRMSSADKDHVMRRFSSGDVQILCSTTVVEVGVDVRNASVMVIDGAEVFGLSQLHQLRGRVGRGDRQSFCVLLADDRAGEVAWERLESFVSTTDGFKLAEVDLTMRGPGQFLGLRQAGAAEFRFGDLVRDAELLAVARQEARRWVLGDAGA